VAQLKEVESKIVKEQIDHDSVNLMRDDFEEELTPPAELLKLAPNREGDFYKVKSVLE
jgi:Asp-tRNA(Asn)/Glu-tRNA(Gln) amidotransferase C subunit